MAAAGPAVAERRSTRGPFWRQTPGGRVDATPAPAPHSTTVVSGACAAPEAFRLARCPGPTVAGQRRTSTGFPHGRRDVCGVVVAAATLPCRGMTWRWTYD